ncbi:lasso peptide biosynthesis B2 protein [Candidatus Odyssella thessalonicensis]|uniref:lasso peptide biosynthesis B2 protein n=1 Tax=Candidatus Odyssella thessalonicensis TaxID=84647 RepID=UPI000225A990|nr:lasso peptide biosynthesis B2 protein [Candidatus Odyssella thessalonicensis]
MYYHLKDHIYITQFRDELILLDTKADKYTIYFKSISNLICNLLENVDNENKGKSTTSLNARLLSNQELGYTQKLLADNILESKDSPYPYSIDRKPTSEGVSDVDWRLPLDAKNAKINLAVLGALFTLIKVNFYIQIKGFYRTIQLIKASKDLKRNYITPSEENLRKLACVVNRACLLYPTRTKCLEWAITFILLALKRGWKCNLEIGVQNYPFMAHAWVECEGKVVEDDQMLREGLGIILNEPFRRLA